MSGRELGALLDVSQSTIDDMERSEARGTIKLETLQRAADRLDCDLVYALVPRTSLDEAVRRRARLKAAQHLRDVSHHTRLEDQTVATEDAEAQLDELAARFIDRRGLWTDASPL